MSCANNTGSSLAWKHPAPDDLICGVWYVYSYVHTGPLYAEVIALAGAL
jgi:hypothetical protein